MNNIVYIFLLCIIISSSSYAQVGIGTTNPDDSSVLDIESTDKGVLIPRLTTAQINAIIDPANGLMVYNTDLKEFQFNCGSIATPDWSKISHPSSVKYSNSDTTTNINNNGSYASIPIFGTLSWNDDTTLYTQAGNTLTINTTGRYKITVNIAYRVPTVNNNSDQRVSVEAQIAINGTPTGTIGNTGYVRHNAGHVEASLHITEVFNITAGQTISVQTIRGGNSAPAVFRSAGTSNIYIEKIK
ncbi:hypothetical protein [Hyunsoonleella pacifica]|uniref:C1q domain-containing protein n=1 Tax=Hyunsoonleella pacifica TaxID=1080224 RepID=A0A4Q9FKW9_9FLAO|nr:hypothetical protein [Hyunsoonleella pacifica]TBN13739.1 hypothetical protein EYD46_14675 [Hyunsoonleella pacifica]GGD25213.1 hypothetical protein GCM10011368_29090 [Hyunsoonleella pacifica]